MSKEIQTNSEVAVSTDTQESTSLLSRSECNIMRGFAILFIIIDNITHLFKGVFLDCEYNFLWSSVEGFLNNLSHPDSILPFNFVSFYCPYGVILFIFLSGYCLTLKYEKGNGQGTSAKDFVVNHYKKLFTMQLKGSTPDLACWQPDQHQHAWTVLVFRNDHGDVYHLSSGHLPSE